MYSEKDIIKICTKHGHTYISGWKTAKIPFNCLCSCGKPRLVYLSNLRKGSICQNCAGNNKRLEKDIIELCIKHGHTYISGWQNSRVPFNCVCICGEPWFCYIDVITSGAHCAVCSGKKSYTKYEVEQELAKFGHTLLSEYKNNKTPIVYKCSCGGEGKSYLSTILNGGGCGKCVENKWVNYFKQYNCIITNYITTEHIEYICSCGEKAKTRTSLFINSDKKCTKCRVIWNTKPDGPMPHRPNLIGWKNSIKERDNFKCQICSSDIWLEVHHIEAYSVKPELVDNKDNAITLCYECHKTVHSLYGYNVGIKNLQPLITRG